MNKENISALIGWAVACIIAIVLFLVGWDMLFTEPVNTDGSIKNQSANTNELTNTQLEAMNALYRDTPGIAKNVLSATGTLSKFTAEEYIKRTNQDGKLKKNMERLIFLNRIVHSRTAARSSIAELTDMIPALKNCRTCSGKLVIRCTKCSKENEVSIGGSRSPFAKTGTSGKCTTCRNEREIFCPACKKAIGAAMKDIVSDITLYCKKKLNEVEKIRKERKTD